MCYGGGAIHSGTRGAINHWVKTGHQWKLDICTYKVRTLLNDDRILELESELENFKWDIIGLAEVRRGENTIHLKSGNCLFWKGYNDKSEAGVGFLINKNIAGNITDFHPKNERIISITIRLNKNYKLKVIQAYAPTTNHPDEEIEEFYEDLDETIKRGKQDFLII